MVIFVKKPLTLAASLLFVTNLSYYRKMLPRSRMIDRCGMAHESYFVARMGVGLQMSAVEADLNLVQLSSYKL
jgi:hypothetical protein